MFFTVFENLCKTKGKSATAVGNELGISKTTISYWRNTEKAIPKQDVLVKIAAYFNVSIDYLLGNTQKQYVDTQINKNNICLRQDTKTPFDNITEPFIATNREMKMIMEYRSKPQVQQQVNMILNKEGSTIVNNDEALMFALYGNDSDDITPAMLEDVRKFAKFIREQRKDDCK